MCCMCQMKTGRIMLAVLLVCVGVMVWSWWADQPRDGVEGSEDAQTSAMLTDRSDGKPALRDVRPVGYSDDGYA